MNSRKGDGIKSLVCIFEDTTICLIAFSNLEKMIVNIKKNIADTAKSCSALSSMLAFSIFNSQEGCTPKKSSFSFFFF